METVLSFGTYLRSFQAGLLFRTQRFAEERLQELIYFLIVFHPGSTAVKIPKAAMTVLFSRTTASPFSR